MTNKRRKLFILSDILAVLRSYFTFHFTGLWYIAAVRKAEFVQVYIICCCFVDACTHRTPNSSWTGSKDLNFQKNFSILEWLACSEHFPNIHKTGKYIK